MEEQHEEHKRSRTEYHTPENFDKPPTKPQEQQTLDNTSAKEEINTSFLSQWLVVGIPLFTSGKLLTWLKERCLDGGFLTRQDNMRKNMVGVLNFSPQNAFFDVTCRLGLMCHTKFIAVGRS